MQVCTTTVRYSSKNGLLVSFNAKLSFSQTFPLGKPVVKKKKVAISNFLAQSE